MIERASPEPFGMLSEQWLLCGPSRGSPVAGIATQVGSNKLHIFSQGGEINLNSSPQPTRASAAKPIALSLSKGSTLALSLSKGSAVSGHLQKGDRIATIILPQTGETQGFPLRAPLNSQIQKVLERMPQKICTDKRSVMRGVKCHNDFYPPHGRLYLAKYKGENHNDQTPEVRTGQSR
jgi:hypothetical protein